MKTVKTCSNCKQEKPTTEFHVRSGHLFHSKCKPCRRIERQAKYAENPEAFRAVSAAWRANNPERAREVDKASKERTKEARRKYGRMHRELNKEKLQAYRKAYYSENRDRLIAMARAIRAERPEKVAEIKIKHYHSVQKHDEGFKAASIARRALKRTLKASGIQKQKETYKYLGYSHKELKAHLERNFSEGMSWENYGEWQVDHIIPIAEFVRLGVTCPKKINALENLVPMWAYENYAKSDNFELMSKPAMH